VKNALEIDRILRRVLPKDEASADDARTLSIDAHDEPAGSPDAFSSAEEAAGPPDDTAAPEIADSPDTSPRDPRSGETP
jgi:hypothetical protein